jgi:hypothetical protein
MFSRQTEELLEIKGFAQKRKLSWRNSKNTLFGTDFFT